MDTEVYTAVSRSEKQMSFLLLHEGANEGAIVCKLTHGCRRQIDIIRVPRFMLGKNHAEAEWVPIERKLVGTGAHLPLEEARSCVDRALTKYANGNDAEPFKIETVGIVSALF